MATLRQKAGLLRGLFTGDTIRSGPVYVDIDLTRRCNLRCFACPCHGPDSGPVAAGEPSTKDMSLEMFTGLCDELATLGTRQIILQGTGEPLLNEHVFSMMEM